MGLTAKMRKRLLHVIPNSHPSYGGPVSTVKGLIEVWNILGFRVDVASCAFNPEIANVIEPKAFFQFSKSFPVRFGGSREYAIWLNKCILDYDLVVIHGVWTVMSLRTAWTSKRSGVPYIYIPHGSLDPYDMQKKSLIKLVLGRLFISRLLEDSRMVLCSSEAEKSRVCVFGAKANIQSIFWPVIKMPVGERARFRRRHRVSDDAFVILFLGRIASKKGLDLLLDAFLALPSGGSGFHMVIAGIGDDEYMSRIKVKCNDSDRADRIVFAGFVEGQLRSDAYAGSDLFVLLSENENFGHTVAEALHHELPVLISENVYIKDVVIDYGVGWVVAMDVSVVSGRLVEIARSPEALRVKRDNTAAAAGEFGVTKLSSRYGEMLARSVMGFERANDMSASGMGAAPREAFKVTHVQGLFSMEHGGPAFSLANTCLEQNRIGYSVSVRVLGGFKNVSAPRTINPLIDQSVCAVAFPEKLGFSWRWRFMLNQDRSPELYHLHGAWFISLLLSAREACFRKRPYIVELMGSYTVYELGRKRLKKHIARLLYQDCILRNAACIHVNAPEEGRMLRRLGLKTPIACIPVGVDLRELDEVLANENFARRVRERPFVLYLGRIHPTKGIENLIKAWGKIDAFRGNFELVIAGLGEASYTFKCQNLSSELVGVDSCVWLGGVSESEKLRLYRDAAVYVLPSLNENFGNTVAEAMACGTPVITTVNTQWTMLERLECGWLSESDPIALEQTFIRFFESGAEEWRRRGSKGRVLVEQEYSLAAAVRKLDRLYRGVIRNEFPADLMLD